MKKLPVIALVLIILILPFSVHASVLSGSDMIQKRMTDINSFITDYKANTTFVSSSDAQQIESQYQSLLASLTIIQANIAKDSGANLSDDIDAINKLMVYEIRLPQLYSELYISKASYLYTKFDLFDKNILPGVVQTISKESYQQGLTLSNTFSQTMSDALIEIQNVRTDYLTIAQIQSTKTGADLIASSKNIFKDIQTRQKALLADFNVCNTSLTQLASL